MSALSVLPIGNFSNVCRTEDGKHIVVLAHLQGRPVPLAIRREEILGLMALLSRGATMTGQMPDASGSRRLAPAQAERAEIKPAQTTEPAGADCYANDTFEWADQFRMRGA